MLLRMAGSGPGGKEAAPERRAGEERKAFRDGVAAIGGLHHRRTEYASPGNLARNAKYIGHLYPNCVKII